MKLFTITGYFKVENIGIVIGGVNPEFDHMSHREIKALIGTSILVIDSDNNKHIFDVVSSQISTSIVNKKNIGICVGFPDRIDFLEKGGIVYRSSS
ncbi:hypothetical protein [Cohnella sp. GCM10027633]|uniref:hypothetical protein n=1 Tax=unclassified Cohnella TaxID=2636738 RepID=UPI003630298B